MKDKILQLETIRVLREFAEAEFTFAKAPESVREMYGDVMDKIEECNEWIQDAFTIDLLAVDKPELNELQKEVLQMLRIARYVCQEFNDSDPLAQISLIYQMAESGVEETSFKIPALLPD